MQILITTQCMENYAAHDWDGSGECPQGWKFKGGDDFIIKADSFRFENDMAAKKAEILVDSLREKIEYSNNYVKRFIVGWNFVEDDYITDFERSQLEYEGEIAFPAYRCTYDQLMETV